jgi:signal transduction histidine kinase
MNDKEFEKLVFGMAHQIRNPSAIIKANAGVILKKENLSPDGLRSMESILNGVKYLEERLDEFVEFSKAVTLNPKEVALDKLVAEACSMLREQCQLKRIKISSNLEPIVLLSADRNQLLVALLNILLNAVEAITDGGNITVKLETLQGSASLTVEDDGIGIHPRDLPEVFSAFYSTKPDSIGIGLPVAKRVIEAHGGRASVQSEKGKGTTVHVILPIKNG